MITVFLLFFTPPMAVAAVAEYLCCRLPKRRGWRWLPPIGSAALFLLVTAFRFYEWGEGPMPLDALVFIPGIPCLGLLAGCWAGWRVWKWVWTPRLK